MAAPERPAHTRGQHLAPIWPPAVIALPPDAARHAIRVQVHGRKVVQRRERHLPSKVPLHGGVAGVVVFVAKGQVGLHRLADELNLPDSNKGSGDSAVAPHTSVTIGSGRLPYRQT